MGLRVGVVGVGPVGDRIIQVMRDRAFPIDGEPVVMATREREEVLAGETFRVRKIEADLFKGLDVAFFAGREGAKGASVQWGAAAIERGCLVVDNGGDFRMHPAYPLVVPEVNMDDVTPQTRHICSPNCSTIQMVVALAPLHRAFRLKRVVVSTYQAVSGWGGAAEEELRKETERVMSGGDPEHDPSIFARPIAFECLPHIDRFLPNGYTKEEMKMVHETRKIMGEPNLLINPTAVRVPVFVGHSESISAEFFEPADAERVRGVFTDSKRSPGVVLIDGPPEGRSDPSAGGDPNRRRYPVTRDLTDDAHRDAVLVGRVRDDTTAANAVNFWCVSDNLRKGAATNVVQIAEAMIERGLLSP